MDILDHPPSANPEEPEPGHWSTSLKATQEQLKRTRKRLERYQAALRLADAEIKRRNRGIIALTTFAYQAGRAVSVANLLKLALVHTLETTKTPVGAIVLMDSETKELSLSVHKGLTPELTRILTGQQLEQGAVALMPHLVAGEGALLEAETSDDEAERQLLEAGQLTSLASLPLHFGPKVLGALLIGLQEQRSFTSAELWFLMAIAQETAIALEGLRLREGLWHTAEVLLDDEEATPGGSKEVGQTDLNLDTSTPFELPDATKTMVPQPAEKDLEQLLAAMVEAEKEVRRQNADLQTLNAIAEQMNRTLNLKEILQNAVGQTRATLNTDAAWLYLVNESGQLEMGAHTGLSKAYVRAMQRLKPEDSVEGRVAVENNAYFIESIVKEGVAHKIWVDKEGLQSLAAAPVTRPEPQDSAGQTGSLVIGVLAAGTTGPQPYTWTPRERQLLTSIANHVALAIDNARLYEKLRENEAGLRAGNQVLQEVNNMLSAENALFSEFMRGHLQPGLAESKQVLERLLTPNSGPLNESQKQELISLQKILDHLNEMFRGVLHKI